MLNPISCHPATIRFESTRYELTTRLLYGDEVCKDAQKSYHRWCTEDGKLAVDWKGGQPALQAVLELLSCQCNRSCKLPSCSCIVNGLRCTDMCRLQDCTNRPDDDDDVVSVDGDDDEGEDSKR